MASLNRVILAGNLTMDPEIRFTSTNMAVTDLRMAVNERYKDKSGEWVEKAIYVDVTVWGRQAETSAEYLNKGSGLLIEGRLRYDQWENKEGEKRSKLAITADRVQFLGKPGESGGSSSGSRSHSESAAQAKAPAAETSSASVNPSSASAKSETPSSPAPSSQAETPKEEHNDDLPF